MPVVDLPGLFSLPPGSCWPGLCLWGASPSFPWTQQHLGPSEPQSWVRRQGGKLTKTHIAFSMRFIYKWYSQIQSSSDGTILLKFPHCNTVTPKQSPLYPNLGLDVARGLPWAKGTFVPFPWGKAPAVAMGYLRLLHQNHWYKSEQPCVRNSVPKKGDRIQWSHCCCYYPTSWTLSTPIALHLWSIPPTTPLFAHWEPTS